MTKEEAKQALFDQLELDGSIIFHVFEVDGHYIVGSGIIADEGDLNMSDRFYDFCDDNYLDRTIDVGIVNTYMIGEGEAENAWAADCAIIEDMLNSREYANDLWEYLEEDADFINRCYIGIINNPCCLPEEEE